MLLSTLSDTDEPNKVDLLPTEYGFIAQLVEHYTSIAEVHDTNYRSQSECCSDISVTQIEPNKLTCSQQHVAS